MAKTTKNKTKKNHTRPTTIQSIRKLHDEKLMEVLAIEVVIQLLEER